MLTDLSALTDGWTARTVQDIKRLEPAVVEVSQRFFENCRCD